VKWKIPLAFGVVCAGVIYVLVNAFGRDPHAVPFMLRGKPAPAFSLPRLDNGKTVTLAELKGHPVVINFWASWCEPCKLEHPVMRQGARLFGNQAQFYGIVFEDTADNAKRALESWGSDFTQLVDPLSGTAVDYGATGVPETYFIDKDGIIQDKKVGPIQLDELADALQKLGVKTTQEAAR
jgi:cytochrome c biogenesis protein CcmG, thiol:disulfide interchange protein DsbE